MVEQGSVFGGNSRQSIRLLFVTCERRRLQERRALVQDGAVTGRTYVFRDDMRQPQQIVGATAAKPATERLVPPVLDVAFDELPCGGAKKVCACKFRPRERQRHDILQLIAEAECAARLVVAAACPEATADRLIQQPLDTRRLLPAGR